MPPSPLLRRLRLPLGTRRLRLERPTLARARSLPRAIGDAQVAGWLLHLPEPYTPRDARLWVARAADQRRSGDALHLFIVEKRTNTLVGGIGIRQISWENRTGELGYWIAREAWGRGFATEAATAVVRTAFGPLALDRLEAGTFDGNRRSQNVLQKLGFRREGRRVGAFLVHGRRRDDVMFGLLKSRSRSGSRSS